MRYSVDFEVVNIPTNIVQENNDKKIIKVINVLGRNVFTEKIKSRFIFMENGKVEKKLIFE